MLIDRALLVACLASPLLTQGTSSRYTRHMRITEQEYLEDKRKLQQERAQLVKRLGTLDKRLEALEVVWSWHNEDQGQRAAPESTQPEPQPESTLPEEDTPMRNGTPKQFSLLAAVYKATQEVGEDIDQPTVTKLLQERFPAENIQGASVSNRLSHLSKLGELEVVRKGSGSRPTIYRRAH
jgi:hypothetical protein